MTMYAMRVECIHVDDESNRFVQIVDDDELNDLLSDESPIVVLSKQCVRWSNEAGRWVAIENQPEPTSK